MSYAEGTAVPPERSRAEIERVLTRYGASHFGYTASPETAQVAFRARGRNVRFELALPNPDGPVSSYTDGTRSPRHGPRSALTKPKCAVVGVRSP